MHGAGKLSHFLNINLRNFVFGLLSNSFIFTSILCLVYSELIVLLNLLLYNNKPVRESLKQYKK